MLKVTYSTYYTVKIIFNVLELNIYNKSKVKYDNISRLLHK